ncbi:YceI family protein [Allosphingosinicella indica]|uniref:Polyisoprenoid-binding protein YceI n=1 Tax=Allosphingosinicella indica TaxID=941907 RepID=A0A1X7FZ25_9SPHN|nr:YceI family protein [Allosphingosinicella indica]SMF61384.1 Polyisoprenoid-binding protein YceI [Allosphingosinicella indica]
MRAVVFALALAAMPAAAIAWQQAAPASPAATAPRDVQAGAYVLDKSHAKIVWGINHLGFSTYYGEFTDFDAKLSLDPANPAASTLEVTVKTASVATHNDKLDAHLKSADFFDAAKFPETRFVSTAVRPTGERSADVTGNLTLHGVTRPVTLAVTYNGAGKSPVSGQYVAGFSATATIQRTEFGIDQYAPALGDAVELKISGEFNPAA